MASSSSVTASLRCSIGRHCRMQASSIPHICISKQHVPHNNFVRRFPPPKARDSSPRYKVQSDPSDHPNKSRTECKSNRHGGSIRHNVSHEKQRGYAYDESSSYVRGPVQSVPQPRIHLCSRLGSSTVSLAL